MENKQKLINAMEVAGYHFDELESYDEWLRFTGDYCSTMTFDSWQDVEEWLEGVVFDDPEVSDAVEKTLHPERFEAHKENEGILDMLHSDNPKESEFGAKRLVELLENGQPETYATCPRCGKKMEGKTTLQALSRRANVYICSDCGMEEAFEDFGIGPKKPFLEWFVVEKVLGK